MTTLSATDATFLYAETDDCPMSIASLQYMQLPADVDIDAFVAALKEFTVARLDWVPYLTNKVQFSSGLLGHPNWIKDPAFDINNHVYTVAVPAPGGRKQVEQTVARLHETPLDRNRPLWDLVVLTGLPDHQVAYYNRVHHACLDGMAAQASTQLLMDTDPNTATAKQPLPQTGGAPINVAAHLQQLFEDMLTQSIDNVYNAPARSTTFSKLWQRALDPAQEMGAALTPCPSTPFNRNIDRARVYATGEIPLDAIRHMAKHLKCTINDVFMAICGDALKAYLERKGVLPEQSLIAGCPVSMRKNGDRANNNQVSMVRIALGTHISDPVERLRYVRRSADQAKRLLIESKPMLRDNITAPALGLGVRGAQLATGLLRSADQLPPPVNVVISNVPGPRQTLYSNGARMLSHYPISIPNHGVGLNITVQSYVDTLFVGVTAARRAAPDADLLRCDIDDAYKALYHALSAQIFDLPQVNRVVPGDKTAAENGPEEQKYAAVYDALNPENALVTGASEKVA